MTANQTECSRFEQRSVIKFLVAEKCKPCEIYRRICNVYVLVKQILQMSQIWVCSSNPELKRQSMVWEHTDSLVKEKFQVLWPVKKMLTVFWDMKGTMTTDFLENVVPVANSSGKICLMY